MAFRLPSAAAKSAKSAWSKNDTQTYLDANPLPRDFKWPHRDHATEDGGGLRPVQPSHASVIAYGKWLRETPYFPGLFELVHEIVAAATDLGDADWIASELTRRRTAKKPETPPLF